jgi:hypothetical protein
MSEFRHMIWRLTEIGQVRLRRHSITRCGAAGLLFLPLSAAEISPRLTIDVSLRGRFECFTDCYYLHRLRAGVTASATSWLRFTAETQDAHAFGYDAPAVPSNLANTFDLRQALIDIGARKEGWRLRVGRQVLSYGEERLIGASNWGNVGRVFDAARVTYTRGALQVDAFTSSVVVPVNREFDRPRFNNKFHGLYASLGDFEAYALLKTMEAYKVYTFGGRAAGALPARFDYSIEMAAQTIHAAAGHWALGYRFRPTWRAIAEYNYASGTFDQLYPTNHGKYGTADRIAWRNIHDAMVGLEWRPRNSLRATLDWHSFWLATRSEPLYTEGGAPLIRNPLAASSHAGSEVDLQVFYVLNPYVNFGAGYAYFMPGAFLKQSGRPGLVRAPYVFWSYEF